jgi:hypothetical protein
MMRIEYAPRLIEAAVLERLAGAVESDPALARCRAERDAVYDGPAGERESACLRWSARWFTELGLDGPLRRALACAAHANGRLGELHVRAAVRAKDEGSELFVEPAADGAGPAATRLVLWVSAARLAWPERMQTLALRELLFADDMLDPRFGHRPALDLPRDLTPIQAERTRAVYAQLWAERVDARIAQMRRPGTPQDPPATQQSLLAQALRRVGGAAAAR